MKKHIKWFNSTLLTLAFVANNVSGQSTPVNLPLITFNDKILERTVGNYMVGSRTKVCSVAVTRQGSLYTYRIESVFFYDEVADIQPTLWGKWGKYVLLFYSSSDLKTVANFTGVPIYKNLLTFVRPVLPNIKTLVEGIGANVFSYQLVEGLTWYLKVDNGEEISLRDSEGHDLEIGLDLPAPPK